DEQDRSLWDRAQIDEGRAVLERALRLHGRGPYVLQAAIASLHADEPRDWSQIAALYAELARLTGSPVVELNRAVAVAEAEGAERRARVAEGRPRRGRRRARRAAEVGGRDRVQPRPGSLPHRRDDGSAHRRVRGARDRSRRGRARDRPLGLVRGLRRQARAG